MGDLYTRSPDIPGPLRSLHMSSLQISSQDLYKRSLYKISCYPCTSLQDLYERSLYRSSLQDPGLYERSLFYTRSSDIPGPPGFLHRSSLQDLFTRLLREISIQELSTRSLGRASMRDPNTRALCKISSLLISLTGALYKISSQAPYETSLYKIS